MTPPLRPFQVETLAALSRAPAVICIAPTGAGKTRIFEEFARARRARVLVISPLVALSRQLRDRLAARGIRATAGWTAGPPAGDGSAVWVLSPETLAQPAAQARLRAWQPNLVVVDECHCIWSWGDSFRPAFATLPEIVSALRAPRSLWLSASLPLPAQRDLLARLPEGSERLNFFAIPTHLHLQFQRVLRADRPRALHHWLEAHTGPGILFAGTRANAERLTDWVRARGRPALRYHAGLAHEERLSLEAQIAKQPPEIVIATSAFGMGMDYAHLGWSLFWQAPASLLELIQGIGRAGRDPTRKSVAGVLWDPTDFHGWDWIGRGSTQRREELAEAHRFFHTSRCRVSELQRAFRDEGGFPPEYRCGHCDHCDELVCEFDHQSAH